MAKPQTWQARGEYLASCFGMTSTAFAAGIDTAIAGQPQGTAARPATMAAGTGGAKSGTRRTKTAGAGV